MIKARASGSKVYLYFMKKGRQVRHRIPWNSCFIRYNMNAYNLINISRFQVIEKYGKPFYYLLAKIDILFLYDISYIEYKIFNI